MEACFEGGTGACVRCEEAGTRPSARVGLAMSVFTHGVIQKGKPPILNRNKVFAVGKKDIYGAKSERTYHCCRSCPINPQRARNAGIQFTEFLKEVCSIISEFVERNVLKFWGIVPRPRRVRVLARIWIYWPGPVRKALRSI